MQERYISSYLIDPSSKQNQHVTCQKQHIELR